MKVLVLGGDGYRGWPTFLHLSEAGHEVAVLGVATSLSPVAGSDECVAEASPAEPSTLRAT
ncbi:MAG: hypothetical protein ACR2GU_04210 [Rubrobacteraceae bacterium]